ncbi:MAG: LysM peptidoglycan-binding domain-containing protein [Caldilineaceae bacterium]
MANAKKYGRFSIIRLFIILLTSISCLFTALPVRAYSAIHVVQPGESLLQIARRYGVSMSALAAANQIGNTDYIYTGQQLVIPSDSDSGSYSSASETSSSDSYVTVGRGDSLSQIAVLYGMTTAELMQLNGLSNPDHVWIGQRLQVRGGGGNSGGSNSTYEPVAGDGSTHVVQRGETLSQIAKRYGLSVQHLMGINGLSNPNHVWVGQQLTVVGGTPNTIDTRYAPVAGKRIEVNLATQTLTAWHGARVVLNTTISSGTDYAPTVTGRYHIDRKYAVQRMIGPGYDIPDVPSVMYFWDGYAFHGAYWHNNFGTPMSHGCIHLRPSEADYLYNWADFGTEVYIHW